MAHLHPVYDTDPHFSIDSTSRGITYESTERLVIVQGDHNSQRYTFELPRYIDGHDMMLCDLVQVHYINIESGGRGRNTGVYKVTDMQLATDDDQVVVLSWLLSQNATKYVGSLNFVVRFACTSGSKIDYAWSTTVYSAVSIITSIDNADLVVEQYTDVLEQWYMELLMAGTSSADTVYAARDASIEDINEAKTGAISDIGTAKTGAISDINTSANTAKTTAIAAVEGAEDTVVQNVIDRTDEYFNSLQNGAYKIIEQKASKKVDFWFGTKAEYDAIPASERAADRVYIPSDDTTLDDIDQMFEDIISGNQTVGQADQAVNANYATSAGSAAEAENADYATSAGSATSANEASIVNNGEVIFNATQESDCLASIQITSPGLYLINSYTYMSNGTASGGPTTFWLFIADLNKSCSSPSYITLNSSTHAIGTVTTAEYTPSNGIRVRQQYADGSEDQYQKIMTVSKIMSFDNTVINTITFKINNTTCTAKRGTTWYQYANSSAPAQVGLTLTCAAASNTVKYGDSTSTTHVYLSGATGNTIVKGNDVITPGATYVVATD